MKKFSKPNYLTQIVLASTLFVTSIAHSFNVTGGQEQNLHTNNVGNINVLPDGKVIANGESAVTLDNGNSTDNNLTIQPFNILGPSAKAVFSNQNEFAVLVNEPGTITVYQGSGITSTLSDGIGIVNVNANILNYGIIQGESHAIETANGNVEITINNKSSGRIQNFDPSAVGSVIFFNESAPLDLSLNNEGLLLQTSTASWDLVDINVTTLNGSIVNTGQMLITKASNGSSIISIRPNGIDGTFKIVNKSCGLMSNNGSGSVILLPTGGGGFQGIVQNDGLMFSNTGPAFDWQDFSGGIINNGTLFTRSNTTMNINSYITLLSGIVNNGDIISAIINNEKIAINISDNNSITIYQNNGSITGDVFLASYGSDSSNNVFQLNDGLIAGDIYTSVSGIFGSSLTLKKGEILGNIILQNTSGSNEIIVLSGTKITGIINANDSDGNNIYQISALPGQNKVTGSFNGLIGNLSDTLQINNTFTNNGFIDNVDAIEVNGTSTMPTIFTQNNLITRADPEGVDINQYATMVQNSNIYFNFNEPLVSVNAGGKLVINKAVVTQLGDEGSQVIVQNSGIIELGNSGVLNITGYNQDPTTPLFENTTGGTYQVHLKGFGSAVTSGQILVTNTSETINNNTGIVFQDQSFIAPIIDSGIILDGQAFSIAVDLQQASIEDGGVIVLPGSATVQFHTYLTGPNNSILQLIADVTPFSEIAEDSPAFSFAEDLDAFLTINASSLMQNFVNQLQAIITNDALNDALIAALPLFNYGLIEASHFGMDSAFDSSLARIEQLHGGLRHRYHKHHGKNYGDNYAPGAGWVKLLGASIDQDEHHEVDGYKIKAGGIAIGADWDINDCTLLGISASYVKADLDDKNDFAPKDANVNSWQGTAYGWFEFNHGWYMDAALGVALNDYDTDRFVPLTLGGQNPAEDPCEVTSFVPDFFHARGDFDGWQVGGQLNVGWQWINNDCFYMLPFARLKVIYVNFEDYTETGDGNFNLAVSYEDNTHLLGGLGFRFGGRIGNGDIVYVPELTAMIAYDFINDGQEGSFTLFDLTDIQLDGVKPSRASFNLGVGLNAYTRGSSMVSIKYNLDLRDRFVGNSGWVRYTYLW